MITIFIIVVLPYVSLCQMCKEPDLSKLQQTPQNGLHESFSQIAPLLSSMVRLADVPSQYKNIQIATLRRQRKCSRLELVARRNAGPLCPTYHVINYDENRKPESLVESRCNCKSCFDPNAPNGLSTLLACQPLVYYTRVLRRFDCQNGTYVYHSTWEPLQVGCTCNFPQHRPGDTFNTPKAPVKRDTRSILRDILREKTILNR